MGTEHDLWMKGLGIDLDGLVAKTREVGKQVDAAVTGTFDSARDSVLSAAGASPETLARVKSLEHNIDDYKKGEDEGVMEGVGDLLNMAAPVQFAKAASRISGAEDKQAEMQKIAAEKMETMKGIAGFVLNPFSGAELGGRVVDGAVKAHDEGHLARWAGNFVGHGEVIAATVAVTAGAGGIAGSLAVAEGGGVALAEGGGVALAEGGSVALAEGGGVALAEGGGVALAEGAEGAGTGLARATTAAVEEGSGLVAEEGAGSAGARSAGSAPPVSEFPATEPAPTLRSSPGGDPISPAAESVPGSQVGQPPPSQIPPTQLPEPEVPGPPTLRSAEPVSPLAESVRPPEVAESPATQPGLGEPQAPDPTPNPPTRPGLGDPDTLRNPGVPEPFPEAPSFRPVEE